LVLLLLLFPDLLFANSFYDGCLFFIDNYRGNETDHSFPAFRLSENYKYEAYTTTNEIENHP